MFILLGLVGPKGWQGEPGKQGAPGNVGSPGLRGQDGMYIKHEVILVNKLPKHYNIDNIS